MEAKSVMELFDYCWFEENIFKKESNRRPNSNGVLKIEIQNNPEKLNLLPRSRSILSRSASEDLTSQVSFMSGSASPHSVLLHHMPQLQTVPSGKEMKEDHGGRVVIQLGNKKKKKKKKRRGSSLSKSLSELEFEEVKGFMDLGFVFSEEDEQSDLASIIPGLGKNKKKEEMETSNAIRPYLSETWEWLDLDRRNKEKPLPLMMLLKLKLNETEMKHNLKSWAHTVALASAITC